jgi:YrbI family 3-deoxy-D-manno-octulosonate 8-phosphate phosphatase
MTKPRNRISLFVTDVDGTLTDGGMYYTAEGEYMKRFDTRDAKGLERLRSAGVEVAVVTQEASHIVLVRMAKLGLVRVHIGEHDKLGRVRSICQEMGIGMEAVAYVGDDVNDLEVMAAVGFSFAPADAQPPVAAAATVHLSRAGGHGAVREAAEWIIANTL